LIEPIGLPHSWGRELKAVVSPEPSGMRGRFEIGRLGGNEKPEQEQNNRDKIAKKEVFTDVSALLMNYDSL
jgi:hypothetical protein